MFMEERQRKGSKIATQTAFIPTFENFHSLTEYYKVFGALGIQDVGASGINNIGGLIKNANELRLPEQYNKGHKKSPCWRLFIDLSICADGKAVVCCQDVRGTQILGDLNKEHIADIWNGKEYTRIREAHVNFKQEEVEFCKDCDYMESFCEPSFWTKPPESIK